ncbi:homeobox protein knotted-1-like 1 [Tripterygium wilfordii]|uniref:homeobox protein knotted-1-like 1 n=1 Tax=Tripterygium wilfordii TaxID=458696 RepID=UPI0018F83D87|nr:homeobox protein knotted-1-like 1 [Tripterygium wilfordii]
MEDLYNNGFDPTASCSSDIVRLDNFPASANFSSDNLVQFGAHESDISDLIKTQIANHPRYPNLISAYIECRKVGAPPEAASLLEEIGKENYHINNCSEIGVDPELDEFMESYCEVLHRHKEELSKPFDEATTFLNDIESQLSSLCNGTLTKALDYLSDGTSDVEQSCGEIEPPESQASSAQNQNIKGMLMRKYSDALGNLRKEFLRKRKNGKLSKDAKMVLLDWWNDHYRWPYPTEEDKMKLSEATGLDQQQINNWFINQRKRHWKPSEDMRFALMEDLSSSLTNTAVAGDDI